uniref:Uncharacterized protein n=1 Tax=Crocodylus porosus TaxID=8502 RepID=A0A7M4EWG4_CROPO
MKKIFGFGKKKKGLPSPSKSASLPVGSGGYGLRERDLGKLHRAAATGDLGKLQQLLRKQDSNQLDKENRTPLHLACANGHLDIVSYLIENKCKLNLCDNDSRSPLMKAVQCQQEKCATLLLEHGADPNVVDVNCNTALHFAACIPNISLAIELLEHDADIDAQNKDGHTPLTLAITENHQGMVEFLLQKGADVHAVDKSKRTPLMVAASGGELSLIKILLEHGADLSHKDVSGCTAEDYAHLGGYSGLGKQLSEYARWKTVEKPSPGNKKGMSVFSSPDRFGDLGYALGAPATDKEEMQQSPNQTSRTRDSGKVIDDLSQGDSVRSSEKGEGDDSWLSSEEELDFTPKKQPKLNLSLLLRASQKFKENNGEDTKMEGPQSSKQNLKQVDTKDKKEGKKLRDQESSDTSNQEEGELEEEEEDGEDDEDEEEEEEEEEEELSREEKEDEDLEEEEESQSDGTDGKEEECFKKSQDKGEIVQELETISNTINCETEDKDGSENVPEGNQKTCEDIDQNIQESIDIPMSFIDGFYEGLNEDVTTVSSKLINSGQPQREGDNEHEEMEYQNPKKLQDTEGIQKISCVTEAGLHRKNSYSSEYSEMTAGEKTASPSVLNSCDIKGKTSDVQGDISESDDDPWSETGNQGHESRSHNAVSAKPLEPSVGKERYENPEELDNTACSLLIQESENLPLHDQEEIMKETFQTSTKVSKNDQFKLYTGNAEIKKKDNDCQVKNVNRTM